MEGTEFMITYPVKNPRELDDIEKTFANLLQVMLANPSLADELFKTWRTVYWKPMELKPGETFKQY
jgi:hypothetical protein